MSFKDFTNDFKKNITGNSLFFYGAEDFLMRWAIEQIKDRYVAQEYRSFDVVDLQGDECSADDILAAAKSYSMFSERRIVIVRNYLPAVKGGIKAEGGADSRLIDLCGEPNDSSVVIFVVDSKNRNNISAYGKKLMKACKAYDFARLEKAELTGFINKRIHKAGLMIGRRELQYLIDMSGYYYKDSDYNLNELERDLFKLTNACEGNSIDNHLIDELLVGAEDKFVFNLIDALMNGNKKKAMELTTSILSDDDSAMMLLSLITKQFEMMYDSLELSDEGYTMSAMAKELGVNEFRFKKAFQAARGFQKKRIKNILVYLYNTDRDIKRGNIDRNIALELFVASV